MRGTIAGSIEKKNVGSVAQSRKHLSTASRWPARPACSPPPRAQVEFSVGHNARGHCHEDKYHPPFSGFLLVFGGTSLPCWSAEFQVTKTGDSLVDSKALTIQGSFGQAINGKSFQQDALVSHNGYQYVGYYDADRHVCLARRKLPDGPWAIIRFGDYDFKSNDAHNTISLGICPKDGTIHMAFDHHVHPLHYRVSQKGVATDPEKCSMAGFAFRARHFAPGEEQDPYSHLSTFLADARGWPAVLLPPRRLRSHGDRMLVDYHPESGLWGEPATDRFEGRCVS